MATAPPQEIPGPKTLIGHGLCARTYKLGNIVSKMPIYDHQLQMSIDCIRQEAQIYRHLSKHSSIIECLSDSDSHVYLIFAANGNLEDYIKFHPDTPTEFRLNFARKATEAVAYVHSKGVIHGDIAARRFLLDEQLNVKLSGFAYASFVGEKGLDVISWRHSHPSVNMAPKTVKSDLFALGCTLYEIMQGKEPYAEVHDHDVRKLYSQKLFPDVDGLCCGDVILDCWNCKFSSAAEILERILVPAEPVAIPDAQAAGRISNVVWGYCKLWWGLTLGRISNVAWDYWKLWWGLMMGRPDHSQKWKEAQE